MVLLQYLREPLELFVEELILSTMATVEHLLDAAIKRFQLCLPGAAVLGPEVQEDNGSRDDGLDLAGRGMNSLHQLLKGGELVVPEAIGARQLGTEECPVDEGINDHSSANGVLLEGPEELMEWDTTGKDGIRQLGLLIRIGKDGCLGQLQQTFHFC